MGINKETLVEQRVMFGGLFENMVIVEVIKNLYASGRQPMLSFFRESNGKEIDLIIECKGKTLPVEIKSGLTIQQDYFSQLSWFKQQVGPQVKPIIIYGGDQNQQRTLGTVVSWQYINQALKQLLDN